MGFSRQEYWSGLPLPSPLSVCIRGLHYLAPTKMHTLNQLGSWAGGEGGKPRMRWSDSITDSMDMSLRKLWNIVKDREGWCAVVHGVSKCWMWLNYRLSHVRLFVTKWAIQSMNSPCQNTGVGSLSHIRGIFPTQVSNQGLPHCRQTLYQLNHKGGPRILEWVAFPFSSRSSGLRNQTRVSCISGRFFTNWAVLKW